jgi:hypothetical protein
VFFVLIYFFIYSYSKDIFFSQDSINYEGLEVGFSPAKFIAVVLIQLAFVSPQFSSIRVALENWQQGGLSYNLQLPHPVLALDSIAFIVLIGCLFALALIRYGSYFYMESVKSSNLERSRLQIGMLVVICLFPTVVFGLSEKYLREIPLILTSYLGYPLTIVLLLILFPIMFSGLMVYKRSLFAVVLAAISLALVSNFLTSEINQKNQSLLVEAQETLVGLNPKDQICTSIQGVRVLNYANLGEIMANHLDKLQKLKDKDFSCGD